LYIKQRKELAGSNHVVKYVKSRSHKKCVLQAGFKIRLSEEKIVGKKKRNWLTRRRLYSCILIGHDYRPSALF